MNPFVRKVKTVEEKNRLLEEARADYAAAGVMSFLLAATTEEYLEKVSDGIEVETTFAPPAALTAAESAAFGRRLAEDSIIDRVFASRRTDVNNLPNVLQKFADEQEAAELETFLAPTRRANEAIDAMVQKAIARAFANGGSSLPSSGIFPKPIQGREGLAALLQNAVDPSSDVVTFVRAFISGDELAMRKVARELAAEAA